MTVAMTVLLNKYGKIQKMVTCSIAKDCLAALYQIGCKKLLVNTQEGPLHRVSPWDMP